ncbi:MAG: NAD(P)/FAD-dependent oxidoreductase [Gemmatimonadaceae bacterium]
MDLTSPREFWLLRNGIGDVPPPLPGDSRCDVALIGAGITGAFVADALTAAGLSVIAIDRRHPAHGSTCASTALLQYDLDASLTDLTATLGRERAVDAYRATLDGVEAIGRIADSLETDVGFCRRPSLYRASRAGDAKDLRTEAETRRAAGLPCEFLEAADIARLVDFRATAALWNESSAEVDPWCLTKALLARCATRNFAVYGRTEASRIVPGKSGVEVHTNRGRISARNVVIAAGYESEKFLPKRVAKLHSTYAIVTQPVQSFDGWEKRCLIWETARPYLYFRTTPDDRIMVGVEDDAFRDPEHRDARVPGKCRKLLQKTRRLFPRIDVEIAYGWAGTFGETDDSLPYAGLHPDADKRVLFALAYGANGMPFAAIAAEILAASILGERHRYEDTFSFNR